MTKKFISWFFALSWPTNVR